ncbi:hypothetical protein AUR64_16845 [Haloprofundus marisrubri]|uniref:Uncharacterized protein n=1 Tax=Haloprofundus marisrubri TaxID=1514971 RepID=A0A0W1R8W7_9EURY|nr:hypothetical protein [Haloprofundus marisrubri]KTG09444.1 hypothetical protein AUR64_16845 [Haloprofundus marisrubri]
MSYPVPRRALLQTGTTALVALAGCLSGNGDETYTAVPRETDPVRTEGEPLRITRSVSSLGARLHENGSVDAGNDATPVAFDEWATDESSDIAAEEVRRKLLEQTGSSETGLDVWADDAANSVLVTTTTTVEREHADVAFPSSLYRKAVEHCPRTVTVILTADGERATTEFAVSARAILQTV